MLEVGDAQWVRAFTVQTCRPEFEATAPTLKARHNYEGLQGQHQEELPTQHA